MIGTINFPWYFGPLALLFLAAPFVWIIFALILGSYSFVRRGLYRQNMLYVFLPQSVIIIALWIFLEDFDSVSIGNLISIAVVIASGVVLLFTPRSVATREKSRVLLLSGWLIFVVLMAFVSPSYYEKYEKKRSSNMRKAIYAALDRNDELELSKQFSQLPKGSERYDIFFNVISFKHPESAYRLLLKIGMSPFRSKSNDTTISAGHDTGIYTAFKDCNLVAVRVFMEDVKPLPLADERRDAIISSYLLSTTLKMMNRPEEKTCALTLADFLVNHYPELIQKEAKINVLWKNKTLSDQFIAQKNADAVLFLKKHGDTVSTSMLPGEFVLLGKTKQLMEVIRRDPSILAKKIWSDISLAEYILNDGTETSIRSLLDSGFIRWSDFEKEVTYYRDGNTETVMKNSLLESALDREMKYDNAIPGLTALSIMQMTRQGAFISDSQLIYLIRRLMNHASNDEKKSIKNILNHGISCLHLQQSFETVYRSSDYGSSDYGYESLKSGIDEACQL